MAPFTELRTWHISTWIKPAHLKWFRLKHGETKRNGWADWCVDRLDNADDRRVQRNHWLAHLFQLMLAARSNSVGSMMVNAIIVSWINNASRSERKRTGRQVRVEVNWKKQIVSLLELNVLGGWGESEERRRKCPWSGSGPGGGDRAKAIEIQQAGS